MVDYAALIQQSVNAMIKQNVGGIVSNQGQDVQHDMGPPRKRFRENGVPIPNDGPPQNAEVRFDDATTAQLAANTLNGSDLGGTIIMVELDPGSKDGTRIKVSGIPSGAGWQDIKDHFNQVGRVAFADIKGKGKGRAGGTGEPVSGLIRYETPEEAIAAVNTFNGTMVGDRVIEVKLHGGCTDKTKIQIFNLPPGFAWQDLKDVFKQIGHVVFAETLEEGGATRIGEVRYEEFEHCQAAMKMLNGSKLGGSQIWIEPDRQSMDGTRLLIHGIPTGIAWQELKDHFQGIGKVAFCDIKGAKGSKGQGKGGMIGMGGQGKGKGNMMGMGGGMDGMMMNFMGNVMGQAAQNMKGGPKRPSGASGQGQVSYANPMHCQCAIQMLNCSTLNGSPILVDWDPNDATGQTLWVGQINNITTAKQVKDHFSCIGLVTYCMVKPASGPPQEVY